MTVRDTARSGGFSPGNRCKQRKNVLKSYFRNKKTVATLIFMLALFLLTLTAVFRGQDLGDVIAALKEADFRYITAAVICVLIFLFIQGICIWLSLKALRQKTNLFHCTLYSFTGYFYCCITPFQMGGPPMQIYYMHKEKIPVPVSSVLLLIIAWMYKLVLVIVGALVLIFGAKYTLGPLWKIMPVYGIGMLFTVAFCAFLGLMIFHPNLARRFLKKLISLLERAHLMHYKEDRTRKLDAAMDKYKETASIFWDHKILMVVILILSIVQRFVLFTATYFVYRALGLYGTGWFQIVIFQAIIPLCVDMLPIPGGIGLSEWLFMDIFVGIFVGDTLIPGLVLSRGISYYVQLIICAAVAVITHLYFRRYARKMREKDEQAQ